jgi:hypothetical protein
MLRLLIPVVHHEGALEAARHAAFLFVERSVAGAELTEVLEPQSKAECPHSTPPLLCAYSRSPRC